MNFRATNKPDEGYEYCASFNSEAEAREHGIFAQYAHVWALEWEPDAPDWTEFPVQYD
jgi:hypothetical protein